MSHLTATLSTQRLDLTGGVRWEVVMVHVALAVGGAQSIELLRFTQRAQRRKGQDLSLTAGEQAGPVCTRRKTDFTPNGADLGRRAAIGTFALAQNAFTHDGLFRLVKCLTDRAERRSVCQHIHDGGENFCNGVALRIWHL